jgi:hypothetical protein
MQQLEGRKHLEDIGVDGRIILKFTEMGFEDVNWILLTLYRSNDGLL